MVVEGVFEDDGGGGVLGVWGVWGFWLVCLCSCSGGVME